MSALLSRDFQVALGYGDEVLPLFLLLTLKLGKLLIKAANDVILQSVPANDNCDPSDCPGELQVKFERKLAENFRFELAANLFEFLIFDLFCPLDGDLVDGEDFLQVKVLLRIVLIATLIRLLMVIIDDISTLDR